jgi:hypothetical protein
VIDAVLRELFGRFNFTIAESTPYDVQVAVDPEMLGKVFEELVTGRHETGSYYTPRPIVAFMCRESLKGYLTTRVENLSAEAAAAFVDDNRVDQLTVGQAREVLAALETVTALDPACGSGAYLLGMMQELIEQQLLLYNSDLIQGAKDLYELKLEVIERNLYGVDIDPFSVNIAMLRLWLSLVIDYDGPGDPPPLPNLAFKIVCGDSLLAPDPQVATTLFREQVHRQVTELVRRKGEFMREVGERKRKVERQIKNTEAQIREWLSYDLAPTPTGSVDWRVRFAEVFDARGGFDIVLANPPYVRMELFRDIKPTLRKNYPLTHSDRADLYVYFYDRALQLLHPDGMLVIISSNKWLRANYGARLRSHIAKIAAVLSVTDFGDLPVFEAATAYPMILVAQKGSRNGSPCFTSVKSLGPPYPDMRMLVEQSGQLLPASAISGENWHLSDGASALRLQAMTAMSVPLSEYSQGLIYYGVKTGLNSAFIITSAKRAELIAANPECAEVIKPLVIGKDIRKWGINNGDRWLLYMYHGVDSRRLPAVIAHLRPYRQQLEQRATEQEWYELQQPQMRYMPAFERHKIVMPDIAKGLRFAFDTSGAYLTNTAYFIPTDDLYLLGVLNSQPVEDFYMDMSAQIRGGYVRFFRQYVERIPVPKAPATDRSAIADLVQRCLDAKGQGTQVAEWEAEINARVTRLYGLSEQEPGRIAPPK